MKCKDCKWWSGDRKEKKGVGLCHRSAPPVRLCCDENIVDNPELEDICYYKVEWPYTNDKDWCGEFRQYE